MSPSLAAVPLHADHPAPPAVRRPVAVVVSRFPLITETFILREIEELERQGQPVVLVPLIRERSAVSHREADRWVERMLYAPFVSPGVLAENLRVLWRHPATYVGVLAELIAGAARSSNVLFRTLALFPKTVYLSARLDELGIRHVHAHFATYPAAAAWAISRLGHASYSFTAHAHDIFVPWRRASLQRKIRQARFVRAIAEHGRRELAGIEGNGAASKIDVIHVGVRPEDYRWQAAPPLPDPPTLLCVAALKPYKGLAVLLEACARLKRAGRRFHCHIVGDGPLRRAIDDLRASMELQDSVTLHGALRQNDVAALLARAHIAVAPSIVAPDGQMDGIPVALMEAMAAGRPVVASRLSGVPELVDDGVTGLLTEPGNAAELAGAIRRLLDSPAFAVRIGAQGREKILREFRLDQSVSALLRRIDAHNEPPDGVDERWQEPLRRLVPGQAIGIRRVHERPDSTVLELVAGDGRSARDLILKIHADRPGSDRSASERACHEFLALERLRPMADRGHESAEGFVYAVPRVFARAGAALLLEACDGRLLVDPIRGSRLGGRVRRRQLLDAMRHTGRWLRVFQQHAGRGADGRRSFEALLAQAHLDLDACVEGGLLTARGHVPVLERLDRLAGRTAAALAPGSPTSGHHGDFWPGNVVVGRRHITAIDFEGFRQGLPYEDAAYFLVQLDLFFPLTPFYRYRHALHAAFLDGYLDGAPLDEPVFAFCRLVKTLQVLARSRYQAPTNGGAPRLRALRRMAVRG